MKSLGLKQLLEQYQVTEVMSKPVEYRQLKQIIRNA
jgi:hypothetical protein